MLYSYYKILDCLGVNLGRVQMIRKELDEFNGDYKGIADWKSHYDRTDKKRAPEFVGEIKAMIDNDHHELNKAVDREMEGS